MTRPVPASDSRRTELQRSPVPVPGWEIAQTLAEILQGVASGRYSHPEPEVGYILRGDVAVESDDRPTLRLRTGDPFAIPPDVDDARDVGAVTMRVLSASVVDESRPLATLHN